MGTTFLQASKRIWGLKRIQASWIPTTFLQALKRIWGLKTTTMTTATITMTTPATQSALTTMTTLTIITAMTTTSADVTVESESFPIKFWSWVDPEEDPE